MRQSIVLSLFSVLAISAGNAFSQSVLTNDVRYAVHSDSNGISTPGVKFAPDQAYEKNQWTGDWIWLNSTAFNNYQQTKTEWGKNEGYGGQYKALFRKQFDLATIPQDVICSITADVFFRLYINGQYVAQGPANIGNDFFDGTPPQHWFYTSHNIKAYLQQGRNTIAVEVYSHYREISETSSDRGMLICDIDGPGKQPIVATDASWKCNIDTSFQVKDGNFFVEAGAAQADWYTKDYPDAGWPNASLVAMKKAGYLLKSKIPVPLRYPVQAVGMSGTPKEVFNTELQAAEFTLDYGRNMTAYYGFDLMAHQGDTISIYPYEKKDASLNRALHFVCREGRNHFEAPWLSVFRYLNVKVVSPKGMRLNTISTEFSSYPVEYRGSFACSDPFLTQLWNITRWTTQLCMNDMFYDSPKHQEPIACTGDYLIESLINYYAFGDPWLTRQTLVKTALMLQKNQYDMFHTSYSLLWVQMLKHYYDYTGDKALVLELIPHVNKLNQLFATYLDADYLVSNAPDYMFMDWIKIGQYNAHHPPAVIGMGYMTAFYYKSLLDAAELNQLVDNGAVRTQNLALAAKIKSGMNHLLWDQDNQRYKDGLPFRNHAKLNYFFPEDKDTVTYSPHVNTLAVLYDIAPKPQQAGIMEYVLHQSDIELQPYFMYFVLGAIEHVGAFNSAGLAQLQKWRGGINTETYTLKENWQDVTATGYGGDYSHAWGGSPLYYLSRNMLGVSAMNGVVSITPFISEQISWAKGSVPLADGSILTLDWKRETAKRYVFTLAVPRGQAVVMSMPEILRGKGFRLNGKRYPANTKQVSMKSGVNRLELE